MTATLNKPPLSSKLAFSNYAATQRLKALAANPPDLTKPGILTPERLTKYSTENAGYTILFGTERINDEILTALKELAAESKALEKMKKMQAGEVMNFINGYPSENRTVLHTAMRDFFDNPQTGKAAAEATALERKELDKIKAFMEKNDQTNQFTDMVTIAIGGSDLGPKSVHGALNFYQKPNRRVHFISNVDPDATARVLRDLDLKKTLVSVVSKSGTTMETVANEAFMRAQFTKAGLDPNKHFISITGEGSPLDDPKKYIQSFFSWDFVGGRFSTSAVYGGVLLSFAYGFQTFWEFLKGAHAMDQVALEPNIEKNLPLLLALIGIWNRNFLNHHDLVIVPYSQQLEFFQSHMQQVDMESNGKRIDKNGVAVDFETGPLLWGQTGTVAQHSFYQLLHQGTTIAPLELIGFKKSQYGLDNEENGTSNQEKLLSNLLAQTIALAEGKSSDNPNKVFPGNRPSHIIFGEQLTPYNMGALFAMIEHRVAFQGFIWDINSFDQEGVQLGKVLAVTILSQFEANRKKNSAGKPFPLGEALIKKLKLL